MIIKTSNLPLDLLDVTREAIEFFVETYFDKRMKNRTELITVAFRKFTGDDLACASPVDDGERRLPREFLIEVNNMYRDIPVREYVVTLMHEMVHVKQYCCGDLKQVHLKSLWKGQEIDEAKVDYWDHPWEREAMAIEYGAYTKFVEAKPQYELLQFKPTYTGRAETGWKPPVRKPLTDQ